MNGSGIGMYKVDRGIKNYRNVGRIISFDNKTKMDVWGGDECDQYKGTDSTIFPAGLKKEEGLWAYAPSLCLSIGAHYEKDSTYQGLPTIRFGLDFGDARENEKLQCYCLVPPKNCPKRGLSKVRQPYLCTILINFLFQEQLICLNVLELQLLLACLTFTMLIPLYLPKFNQD